MPRIKDRNARYAWAVSRFSPEELSAIAEKFGHLTCANREDVIVGGGFLTQEEFDALIACPKEGEVTGASAWPLIGGRKTYPLSSVLTPDEADMYYEFKNGYAPSPSRKVHSYTPAPVQDMASFWRFFNMAVKAGDGDEDLKEVFKMFPAAGKYEGLLRLALTRKDDELLEEVKKVIG